MNTQMEEKKLPAALIVSGVLISILGVIRTWALILELIHLLTSRYLSDIMSGSSGTQIILAFVLDIGLTVLIGFCAYGLFRRRTWSITATVIAVACSMLLVLLEIFSVKGWELIIRLGYLLLYIAVLVLALNGKKYLSPRDKGRTEDC